MHRITEPVLFAPRQIPTFWLWVGAALSLFAGGFWLLFPLLFPTAAPSPTLYALNDPIFAYSPGWQVNPQGADPWEPADPWGEPAGVITFTVSGAQIDLGLHTGDYWGYLYITVDGQPANALSVIAGNVNSLGQIAGYKTLYAPERQSANEPAESWVTIHRNPDPATPQQVRVETWRGWGQMPLRGVAMYPALPTAWPRWPGVLLAVLGFWCLVGVVFRVKPPHPNPPQLGEGTVQGQKKKPLLSSQWLLPSSFQDKLGEGWGGVDAALRRAILPLALTGLTLVALGVADTRWWLVLPGLGMLGGVALVRPALWSATLLGGLPFYFRFPLPVLPGRALNLIEVGVWGGLLLIGLRWLFLSVIQPTPNFRSDLYPCQRRDWVGGILAALISWALVATFAAEHFTVALREWRTVFLAAGLFALLLYQTRQPQSDFWPLSSDHWLLLTGWLTGAGLVALVALGQYGADQNLITAEGVWRVRAFYGSPNNLALYLERTLAVTLALLLFANALPMRLLWGGLALIQGAALLLTFSKGALLLGLPAILATLAVGSLVILRRQRRSARLLWWLLGAALVVGLALLPFVGTERFQRLLDFQQGTGFVRLHLWRSAWQMALDDPWLGVGPDNFLYQYRSNYLLPAAWQEPNLNHPHNWLLDWWTRLGLPGLALATLFFGVILYRLWQKVRTGAEPALHLGLLAAVIGALAHGLIDASYALPDLMLVWVLIAYLAGRGE